MLLKLLTPIKFDSKITFFFTVNKADDSPKSPDKAAKNNDDNEDEPDQLQLVVDGEAASNDGPTITKMEDVITIDPDCEELDLNHARIGKIEQLDRMVKLERLFLRWNLLKKIENLDSLTRLVEIELYDNQITEIENLDHLVNLE